LQVPLQSIQVSGNTRKKEAEPQLRCRPNLKKNFKFSNYAQYADKSKDKKTNSTLSAFHIILRLCKLSEATQAICESRKA